MIYIQSIENLYKKANDLKAWLLEDACKGYCIFYDLDTSKRLTKDEIIGLFKDSIKKRQENIKKYQKDIEKTNKPKGVWKEYQNYIALALKDLETAKKKKQVLLSKVEQLKNLQKTTKDELLQSILTNTIKDLSEYWKHLDIEMETCLEMSNKTYEKFAKDKALHLSYCIEAEESNIDLSKKKLKMYSDFAKEVEKLLQ